MDEKTLWKAVLAELQMILSETQYKTWVANTEAQNLTKDSVEVVCDNPFVKKRLEDLRSLIKASIDKVAKGDYDLIIRVGSISKDKKQKTNPKKEPLFSSTKTPSTINSKKAKKSGLSPNLTFDNYIMGENNRLAYAIATAIAEKPGKAYNPFFLHSGVGLGKTHLIHAIGNEICNKFPELNVIYTTGEAFANELIEMIQKGNRGAYSTNKFRNKYRKADVFLIDDIQFIIGKESTQQEFFHTFNSLHMSQKQIVIASDRPPKDFNTLENRITSRFSSGIIADIIKPTLDTRIAILRTKRDRANDNISNEVIDFIATKIDSNIRELEGSYLQVLTYTRSQQTEATVKSAREILSSSILNDEPKDKKVNLNDILKTVASYYSIKIKDIKGKRRTKDIVLPRQVAMYLMYEMTETPYMTIGELIGGRDHTTIMHGVRKIESNLLEKRRTKQDVANIKRVLVG